MRQCKILQSLYAKMFQKVVKLYSDPLEVVVWSLYILSSELGVLDRKTCSTNPGYEGWFWVDENISC